MAPGAATRREQLNRAFNPCKGSPSLSHDVA
jgi:hypothetical protein